MDDLGVPPLYTLDLKGRVDHEHVLGWRHILCRVCRWELTGAFCR